MLPKPLHSATLLALCLSVFSCSDEPRRLALEKRRLLAGGKVVTVEIARTPEEQARGLMFRRILGENEGMLFINESPRMMSFWMKNTRLPLSIAFIDEAGRILNIEKMRPYDDAPRYRSKGPAQCALEMNQGWFERNGVGVGDRVAFENDQ